MMRKLVVEGTTLIIVPHSDDEVLLFGGLIQRLISNKTRVFVALVTNGDYEASTEQEGCAIIPCDEFSCPIKFTNRDTINWTFRGKNRTMGLEHKEVHYGRINLYESWRLLYPRSDT